VLMADPRGGTFGGIFRTIMSAMQDSPLILALYKRDRRVLGQFARSHAGQFKRKTGFNTDLITFMQQVGVVRKDVDPLIMAHIINMLSYGLISMDEITPLADQPPLEHLMDGMADLLDRALTPPDADPEVAKERIRQIIEAAYAQYAADPNATQNAATQPDQE